LNRVYEESLAQFRNSVAKQEKLRLIKTLLGETQELRCLAIGSGTGALTWMLRRDGGDWYAAEAGEESARLASETLSCSVERLQGASLPYPDQHFERVVVFDYFEHIEKDDEFVNELYRVLHPGGQLVGLVPRPPITPVKVLRKALGQTDARHGHVRPGYREKDLSKLLQGKFTLLALRSYSHLVSDFVDNLARWSKDRKSAPSDESGAPSRLAGALYPLLYILTRLDRWLRPGPAHLLAFKAAVSKSSVESRDVEFPDRRTVLVTGATGFIGGHLVKTLQSEGLPVRALVRPNSQPPAGVEAFFGEIWDESVLNSATRGVARVIHLASSFRYNDVDDEWHRKTNVLGTKALARACLENGVERLVHVSTIGVHGAVGNRMADESTEFNPGDIYQRTKVESELWVREFCRDKPMELVVVRPCATYGPGDRRLLKLFRQARWGVMPWVGSGQGRLTYVHVQDLVDFLQLCAVHPEAPGQIFICGDSRPMPSRDLVRLLARFMGRNLRVLPLPLVPVMAAAVVCKSICMKAGISPPLFPRRVRFFTNERCFSSKRAEEKLGFLTQIPLEEGLMSTLCWYIENGWLEPSR
jgi:dihydroflavonol-4-reductase